MSKSALWLFGLLSLFLVLFLVNSSLTDMEFDASIEIVTTNDLRGEMTGYDYVNSTKSTGGLTYISSAIKEIEKESEAFLLLDAGGALQGNFVLDYILSKRKDSGLRLQKHPMLRAMEYLQYDGIGLSYFDFGYGLDILQEIERQNKVKFLNANIYNKVTHARYFQPYLILERTFKSSGRFVPLKIGVIGLMDPGVSAFWGNTAEAISMAEELEKVMPELQKEGVGLRVAVVHLGVLKGNIAQEIEDRLDALTKVSGLDLIVLGFDQESGTSPEFMQVVNQVPVISARARAQSFGLAQLDVNYKDQHWSVKNHRLKFVEGTQHDAAMEKVLAKDHQIIKNVLQEKLATVKRDISNYFSMIHDDFSEQLVNLAQIAYISKNIPKSQKGLPIVSLAGPMGYQSDKDNIFVTLNKGKVSITDVLKFYNRPGTLLAIQITGRDVRDYLEWVSQAFVRIDDQSKEPQYFLNATFPVEYFAMLDGVTYQVDLTQPSRYKGTSIATPNARRIKSLQYRGRNVREGEQFLLVVNTDLATKSPYLNQLVKNSLVWDSETQVRAMLLSYMAEEQEIVPGTAVGWRLDTGKQNELHFTRPAVAAQYLPPRDASGAIQFIRRSSDSQAIYRYQPKAQE